MKTKIIISKKIWLVAGLVLAITAKVHADTKYASLITSPSPLSKNTRAGHLSEAIKGELLVKFKANKSTAYIKSTLTELGIRNIRLIPKFGIYHIKLKDAKKTIKIMDILNKRSDIEYAEPNYILHACKTPNDLMFFTQWGLHNTGAYTGTGISDIDIDATESWDITTGSADTVIALLDTGVDYNHPDLSGNIWINKDEIPNNGIDDDGNGYIDDVRGWDFINNDNNPMDDNNHGTFTAGILGAIGNNSIGISGVCWNVKIMPLKVLDDKGSGDLASILPALAYAIRNGAKITNNSYGGHMAYSDRPLALQDAIETANENNQLFIAAAGNSGYDNDNINPPEGFSIPGPNYPSSFDSPNIIAVAASNYWDRLANQFEDNWDSNYGKTSVDLAAPGDFIWTTAPFNLYQPVSGTSMACPFVSGACALIWTRYPELTNLQIKEMILKGVDIINPVLGRTTLTGGRLNVFKALNQTPPSPPVGLWARWILGEIKLGWNTNTETDLVGYNVYLKRTLVDRYLGTAYYTYIKLNTAIVYANSYTYEDPIGGSNTYVVTAVDKYGNESAYSNEVKSYPVIVDPIFLWTQDSTAAKFNQAGDDSITFVTKHEFNIAASMHSSKDGMKSFTKNVKTLDEINPYWYEIQVDGSLKPLKGARDAKLIKLAHDNKVLLIPYISNNFDPVRVGIVINSKNKTSVHIQNIVNEVTANNYDGINIDYEDCYAKDRDAFTGFIQKLAPALHKKRKILSISVRAKISDEMDLDWKPLGKAVDIFKVMAYDYSWKNTTSGPIAPMYWLEEVTRYTLTQVEPKKLDMGIPFYGYDWTENKAESKTWTEIQDLIRRNNINPYWNNSAQEPYLEYDNHTIYYEDHDSISFKTNLFRSYNIRGISIWRLGGEDPENWEMIKGVIK